jgi:acyl-CoA thioester hydrolase
MPHRHTIRVRYAETDQMGVAHHGALVVWLEECRIEMLRDCGASYRELEANGVFMPVVELAIRYRRSLHFDDVAECATTVTNTGPSRMTFATVVSHAGAVCAEAEVTVAAVGRDGRLTRIPAEVVARMTAGPAP